jgi:hypothetical protein
MIEATSSRRSCKSHSCAVWFTNCGQEEDPADSDDYTTTVAAAAAGEEEAAARVAVAGLAASNQKGVRVSAASRAAQLAGE